MCKRDEWTLQPWKINYAQPAELYDSIMLPSPATNQFHLKPIYHQCSWFDRQVIGYRVKYKHGEMNPNWNNCNLIRRGSYQITTGDLPDWLKRHLPLDPWVPPPSKNDDYYGMVTAAVLEYAAKNFPLVKRIEGDIFVDGKAEAVRFYRLPEAIKGNRALLVLDVTGPPVSAQSGIAHGDDM